MIGTNKLQSHRGEQTNVYFQMFTADHFEKIYGTGFFLCVYPCSFSGDADFDDPDWSLVIEYM